MGGEEEQPGAPSRERRRVLLIALDALGPARFEAFLAEGRLPNLATFCGQAQRAAVASEGGVLGGAVWPTFNSGQGPGFHGRYYSVQWSPREMRHVRTEREDFRYEPFWAALEPCGLKAVILDVPYAPALPSATVRTCLGWGLHDEVEPVSIPPGFRREIERRHGRSMLRFDTLEPQSAADRLSMVRELRESAGRRSRILADIAGDPWWDLCIVNFSEVHRAGHYLSAPRLLAPGLSNESALASILAPLDAAFPGILATVGPATTVILFSLHGTSHQFDYSGFGPALAALFEGRVPRDPEAERDLLRKARDLLPPRLHRAVWRRLPAWYRAARTGRRLQAATRQHSDRLLPLVHDHNAALRLNLRGRERDGVVDPGAAGAVLDAFAAVAGAFVTEIGAPAFVRISRPQQEYPGPRADNLPDALLIANPRIREARTLTAPGRPVVTSRRPEVRDGIHTSEGFCFVSGGAGAGLNAAAVRSLDFAPTILSLLGVLPPAHLHGEPFITGS